MDNIDKIVKQLNRRHRKKNLLNKLQHALNSIPEEEKAKLDDVQHYPATKQLNGAQL